MSDIGGHAPGRCLVRDWADSMASDPDYSVVVEPATADQAAEAFTLYTYAAFCPGCETLVTVVSAHELRRAMAVVR